MSDPNKEQVYDTMIAPLMTQIIECEALGGRPRSIDWWREQIDAALKERT